MCHIFMIVENSHLSEKYKNLCIKADAKNAISSLTKWPRISIKHKKVIND
jgi:hypothetical protein